MKNFKYIGFIVLVILSCTRFEDPTIGLSNKIELTTTRVRVISSDTALFDGNILKDGSEGITDRGFAYNTTAKPKIANKTVKSGVGIGVYSAKATDLLPNTQYFVAAFASNKSGTVYGEDLPFTTPKSVPKLSPTNIASFTPYSAIITSNITLDGGSPVTERGICWSTSPGSTIKNNKIISNSTSSSFDNSIINLTPGSTYYVRSYAINSIGEGYGQEITLKTLDIKLASPDPNCLPATEINYTGATINANITSDGLSNKLETGIIFSVSSNVNDLTFNNINSQTVKSSLVNPGKISMIISNLKVATKYYYVSYAKNEAGISYSPVCSFTTLDYTTPTIDKTCVNASNVGVNIATITGNVLSDGGLSTIEKGFIFNSENINLTYKNSNSQTLISTETVKGSYSYVITSLKPNSKYYYLPYSKNLKGISYGSICNFTTNDFGVPKLNTTCIEPTDLTKTSVKIYSDITDDGGDVDLEKGFIYGNSSILNYSKGSANTLVSSGKGKGSYSFVINNLVKGRTYYYKSYALNSNGKLTYGPLCEFTTEIYDSPTINSTCIAPTNISYTNAIVSGDLISWGGADYDYSNISKGAIWSSNLTDISASIPKGEIQFSGNGAGLFSVNLTNLSSGTKYYYRIFAKNSAGATYGPICSIETKDYSLPSFEQNCTSATYYLTNNSNIIFSDRFFDGGIKTDFGFLYSTNSLDLTITNTNAIKINTNIGIGISGNSNTLSADMRNLKASTTYYYRAYITNPKGTGYGAICSFTTLPPLFPTVTTDTYSNLISLSATIKGTITSDGGGDIIERGFIWSTNPNFTTSTTVPVLGTSTTFSYILTTTLSNKGTRYYKAYAKNIRGFGYGETKFFTYP